MDELRDRIARAIYENEVAHMVRHSVIPESNTLTWNQIAAHPYREVYTTNADAVIAALGLTEEPGHTFYGVNGPCEGVTPGPDPLGIQTPHYRRYVTDWEKMP